MTVSNDPVAGAPHDVGTDAALNSGAAGDAEYLRKLGYTQELDRALGGFSSFAVQFSSIAIGTAMYTTVVVGLGFFGPASFWSVTRPTPRILPAAAASGRGAGEPRACAPKSSRPCSTWQRTTRWRVISTCGTNRRVIWLVIPNGAARRG